MKSRQPHTQHRSPAVMARLTSDGMPTRRGIGAGSTRTASFAQSIAGKYGYRIGDPFGRLSLIFLQQAGMVTRKGRARSSGANSWQTQLQLQLQVLRHPEAPKLPFLERTLVQLVPVWMRHDAVRREAVQAAVQSPAIYEPKTVVKVFRSGQTEASGASIHRDSRTHIIQPYWKISTFAVEHVLKTQHKMTEHHDKLRSDSDTQLLMQRFLDNSTYFMNRKTNAAEPYESREGRLGSALGYRSEPFSWRWEPPTGFAVSRTKHAAAGRTVLRNYAKQISASDSPAETAWKKPVQGVRSIPDRRTRRLTALPVTELLLFKAPFSGVRRRRSSPAQFELARMNPPESVVSAARAHTNERQQHVEQPYNELRQFERGKGYSRFIHDELPSLRKKSLTAFADAASAPVNNDGLSARVLRTVGALLTHLSVGNHQRQSQSGVNSPSAGIQRRRAIPPLQTIGAVGDTPAGSADHMPNAIMRISRNTGRMPAQSVRTAESTASITVLQLLKRAVRNGFGHHTLERLRTDLALQRKVNHATALSSAMVSGTAARMRAERSDVFGNWVARRVRERETGLAAPAAAGVRQPSALRSDRRVNVEASSTAILLASAARGRAASSASQLQPGRAELPAVFDRSVRDLEPRRIRRRVRVSENAQQQFMENDVEANYTQTASQVMQRRASPMLQSTPMLPDTVRSPKSDTASKAADVFAASRLMRAALPYRIVQPGETDRLITTRKLYRQGSWLSQAIKAKEGHAAVQSVQPFVSWEGSAPSVPTARTTMKTVLPAGTAASLAPTAYSQFARRIGPASTTGEALVVRRRAMPVSRQALEQQKENQLPPPAARISSMRQQRMNSDMLSAKRDTWEHRNVVRLTMVDDLRISRMRNAVLLRPDPSGEQQRHSVEAQWRPQDVAASRSVPATDVRELPVSERNAGTWTRRPDISALPPKPFVYEAQRRRSSSRGQQATPEGARASASSTLNRNGMTSASAIRIPYNANQADRISGNRMTGITNQATEDGTNRVSLTSRTKLLRSTQTEAQQSAPIIQTIGYVRSLDSGRPHVSRLRDNAAASFRIARESDAAAASRAGAGGQADITKSSRNGVRTALPVVVKQLLRSTSDRTFNSRMTTTTNNSNGTVDDDGMTYSNIAPSLAAERYYVLEHKTSSSAAEASGRPQAAIGANAGTHIPIDLDWLKPKQPVFQAAASTPQPEENQPQIDLLQLQ